MEENKDDYLHYAPEFDEMVVMSKKRTQYYRDCFLDDAKGQTPLVFLEENDFGFTS